MRTLRSGRDASRGVAQRAVETGLLSYSPAQLNELRGRLAGTAVTPEDPGYNDGRTVFMHTYQHYPQLIVFCTIATDVLACLAFARETGLKVTARSGGHSTAGYSSNDQLVIDVGGISHVLVDRERRTARVGAGANFRKLNLMLDHAGLHVPGGGCESVGVAGYMQGGGYGFTSRLFGMNCDCVEAITMALPDGQVVRATDGMHADLFWAVRGGTGNQFGVLLEVEYRLVPLEPDRLLGFGLMWPLRDRDEIGAAAEVLHQIQLHYTRGGSADRLGLQALMIRTSVPGESGGQVPQLLVRGVYDGPDAECMEKLRPLTDRMADPDRQIQIRQRGRYLQLNEILLQNLDHMDLPTVSLNTKPMVDSRIVGDTQPASAWASIIEHFVEAPDKTSFIAIESYGGAINIVEPDATAFVHRRASMDLFAWTFWTFEKNAAAARGWLDEFGRRAERLSNGHRYQNYPRRGNPDFRRHYFGENLPRLVEIKRRYDPENIFAFEQSIALPEAGES